MKLRQQTVVVPRLGPGTCSNRPSVNSMAKCGLDVMRSLASPKKDRTKVKFTVYKLTTILVGMFNNLCIYIYTYVLLDSIFLSVAMMLNPCLRMATPPRNCQAVYWGMPGAATTSRTNFRNPPNPTHLSEPNTLARPAFQRWNWRSKNNWLWPQQIGIWVWSDQTWSNYTPIWTKFSNPSPTKYVCISTGGLCASSWQEQSHLGCFMLLMKSIDS